MSQKPSTGKESLDSCANYLLPKFEAGATVTKAGILPCPIANHCPDLNKRFSSPSSTEVIVIGAGLAGPLLRVLGSPCLEKKVVILEKHYVVGGLNSFYARKGEKFDVGLHALTNYPSPSSGKTSLLKLCRQLRLSIEQLIIT